MLISVICLAVLAQGGLKLPALFSDNMVLQMGRPVPVWGWAQPGRVVKVEISNQTASVKAGDDGKWMVRLKPMQPGGPFTLTVTADTTKTIENVAVGEVWVCSGQSNMGFTVDGAVNAEAEIHNSSDAMLRMFSVIQTSVEKPAVDVVGHWDVADPRTTGWFSAVGYFYARELRKRLNVPIGMIHTSWGGTPAEAWTSRDALRADPDLKYMVETYEKDLPNMTQARADYKKALDERQADIDRVSSSQKGIDGGWANRDCNESDWITAKPPADVDAALGRPFDGLFWYRKSVAIPADWAGKDLTLQMPSVDDYDVTFFDGTKIGATGPETPNAWSLQRNYTIPGKLVKEGWTVIAVRVMDTGGAGGIIGDPAFFRLSCGNATLPLGGEWKLKVEAELKLKPLPREPMEPGNSWAPGGLYNGMIAPLIPYGIRGAIWYQGESNADRAYQYRRLFQAMIKNWRKDWGQGDFPFYFVQLANFTALATTPVDDGWAELREAQTMALSLRNAGMAVAIDVGNAGDIHPKDKQTVGLRLALNALAKVYGLPVEFSGPMYKSVSFAGSAARVTFSHADGLMSKGGAPVGFAIAGADKKFYWADARIDGSSVVLTSPSVPKPVAVRYGWSANPPVSLYNSAGLPASPFRTDVWPGVTANAK